MSERTIIMNRADHERLAALSENAWLASGHRATFLKQLNHDLNAAKVVEPEEMPPDVVGMNTRVCLYDMKSGEKSEKELVWPGEADSFEGKISILAPLATALIGASVGDVIEFEAPGGRQQLRVEKIVSQPEDRQRAAG